MERLHELVTITQEPGTIEDLKSLVVDSNKISIPLDWYDLEPPYVFPETPVTDENLLALVFYKLGNHQRAFDFVSKELPLYHHLLIATHLQFGYEISPRMIDFCYNTSAHNSAIVNYYGNVEAQLDYQSLKKNFAVALDKAPNDELKVFTAKHYINLLIDYEEWQEAGNLAESQLEIAISKDAENAMNTHLSSILKAQLKVPYDVHELEEVYQLQLTSIAHFEVKNLPVQAGMVLVDAAEIANFKKDFIASKELINRAIQYFKQEDIPEFLGEAGFQKSHLIVYLVEEWKPSIL